MRHSSVGDRSETKKTAEKRGQASSGGDFSSTAEGPTREANEDRPDHPFAPARPPERRKPGAPPGGRRYPAWLLARILFVLLLSFLDAFFTLYLLHMGAAEINPVMAVFLGFGPAVFMAAKYGITAVCVIVMLVGAMHMGAGGDRLANRLFYFLAGAFEIVIVWELYLLFFGMQ
jgi:hypothetical protein